MRRRSGRNCTLLLNVPPDERGLIHESDVKALAGMRALVDKVYGTSLLPAASTSSANTSAAGHAAAAVLDTDLETWWAPSGTAHAGSLTVDAGGPVTFDRVRLQEYVARGQRVSLFEIEAFTEQGWRRIAAGTTIGHTRIVATARTTATQVRVRVHEARGVPMIASLSLHDSSKANDITPADTPGH